MRVDPECLPHALVGRRECYVGAIACVDPTPSGYVRVDPERQVPLRLPVRRSDRLCAR